MRFEVIMAVKMKIMVFWVMMPCCLIGGLETSIAQGPEIVGLFSPEEDGRANFQNGGC
jgi:hypothetical protein